MTKIIYSIFTQIAIMSVIDIILAVLIIFGMIRGFMNGLFLEIASIVAFIAGIYGAIHFSNFTADFLTERVDWDEKTVNITAFVITFIIIVLAIILAGKALTKLANFAMLGIFNKILGAILGGLKIALILSVILIMLDRTNKTFSFLSEEDLNESVLYHPVKSLVPAILPVILDVGNNDLIEDVDEEETVI